jgi:hypothetical protein
MWRRDTNSRLDNAETSRVCVYWLIWDSDDEGLRMGLIAPSECSRRVESWLMMQLYCESVVSL